MTVRVTGFGGADVSLKSTPDGDEEVVHHIVDESALPAGAATEARLVAIEDKLSTLLTHTDNLETLLAAATPAGTNRIGGTYQISGKIIDENGNLLTVKRWFGTLGGTGEVVTGVVGKKLRVLALVVDELTGGSYVTFSLTSTTLSGSTPISPLLTAPAADTLQLPFNPHGWFETAIGEGLGIDPADALGVHLLYVEV
jgi:hypothetical protein